MHLFTSLIVLGLLLTVTAQQQPGQQTATITLPANVIVTQQPQGQQQQQQPTGPPTLNPQPSNAPPPPPSSSVLQKQQEELAKRCPPLDKYISETDDAFFMLLRLVNVYTESPPQPPAPPLNASYEPITILLPKDKTEKFLRANDLDIVKLAEEPLQSVLLAPTLAQHFIRGYWPANALPQQNVSTLCGSQCAQVQFTPQGDRVKIYSGNANVTLTDTNLVNCPGRYVVHAVDDYLYTPVPNPVYATEPALNLAYALGGEFDTYPIVPEGTKAGGG